MEYELIEYLKSFLRKREKVEIVAQIIADITISVAPAATPLAVDASGVPSTAQVGVPYNGALKASGGTAPYTFAVTSGALPDGLTLNADGTITGTPGNAGSFTAEITVTDSAIVQATAKITNTVA